MSDTSSPDSKQSPLHDLHVAAGASFTDFGGWQMPVSYGSDLTEHHAVRNAAGVFDVSHMGNISVTGEDAAAFLDYALAGKLSVTGLMQAKYSLLLDPSGGIIDDLIVYRNADNEYAVVVNAGNRDAAFAAFRERAAGFENLTVRDISDDVAILAVQGPRALEVLETTEGLRIMDGQPSLRDVKNYWSTAGWFGDGSVLIARTGYTGEDGFELYIDVADAAKLWQALLAAGEPLGLAPAGLASRDTLRLEAGMPLYGHELGRDILPAQAGLGRVVALAKEGDFVGREAIEAGLPDGARVLVGLVTEGRRAGRAGYAVFDGDTEVGVITSGALSPTLGHPIAMAMVDPALTEIGTELSIDVRGTKIPATVTALPFYKREKN